MTEKQKRLAAYTRQVLGTTPRGGQEAVRELPGALAESGMSALESVSNDIPLNPGQEFALEAIVLPKLRPAAFIKNGDFPDLPEPWQGLSAFRDELKPVIAAIGRVEVENAGIPYGGTAFLCGPNLMLTNHHVAELFTYGVGGASKLRYLPGRPSRVETGHEHGLGIGMRFKIVKPIMVHPHWDAALLQVEFDEAGLEPPKPLSLRGTPIDPAEFPDRNMVVIGYPYWSEGHDPKLMKEVFNNVYGVKRFQPGRLMRYEPVGSFGHTVEALLHDASTLGGNSGSAVIDVETQQIVALHFAGSYLVANYSVPMWEFARDPRVVDAGVNFVPAPPPGQPRTSSAGGPIWLDVWKGREEPAAPTTGAPSIPAAPVVPNRPEALPPTETPLIDPGWFELYTDQELRRLYQRSPEQFRRLVATSFSPEEAQLIYDTVLFDASVEGVTDRAPDPSLPEIVLIPGIMGSHLNAGGFWGRSWLNLLTLPFANLLTTLGLDPNGNDRNALSPDGYMQMSYANAARTWRRAGFLVHEFSYDWRKPLVDSAQTLNDFLRRRRRARGDARFVLVCHSMGSLVASIYSRDVPDWRDFAEKVVLCGGPLGGSFAIMEILSGEWPLVRKLAALSLDTSLGEMRQMAASFPGALEMLPDPDLFNRPSADVELLFRRESYSEDGRPGADWLAASRRVKHDLRNSPLLGRATCLICIDRRTAGTFVVENGNVRHSRETVRGDGTVPALSAFVPGVPAFQVDFEHGDLLQDPKVLDAVPRIIRGQRIPLATVTPDALNAPILEAPAPPLETLTAKWELEAAAIRERMRAGVATADDVRWVYRTD